MILLHDIVFNNIISVFIMEYPYSYPVGPPALILGPQLQYLKQVLSLLTGGSGARPSEQVSDELQPRHAQEPDTLPHRHVQDQQ